MRPVREVPPAAWRPTAAGFRAGILGAVGVIAALAVRRPDLLVIATPFVVVASWGWATRPQTAPVVRVRMPEEEMREGDIGTWTVEATAPSGIDDLNAVLVVGAFVQTDPVTGTVTAPRERVRDGRVTATVAVRTTRWGQRYLGPCVLGATSAWGAYRTGPVEGPRGSVLALPQPVAFDVRAAMPAPRGVVGLDRSRRAGTGSEFASIRPFQPGDRLRRIHWPSSLRTGSLNVAQTYADEESHVVVIVDATSDIGDREGIDGRPTSLDLTVRAAAALTEHHLARGDRVSVRAAGTTGFPVLRPRTGRAHLRVVLTALAGIEVASERRVDTASVSRRVPYGALVLVLTPLLSDASVQVVSRLAATGSDVVVVDTLPTDVGVSGTSWAELAWRIRRLTRSLDVERLASAGVPIVQWRGPGSLDHVLRAMAARARAPRAARR